MFGNTTGWIISVVMVAVALLVGNMMLTAAQPTAGSGNVDARFAPLSLDDTARAVMPPTNNLKDDAGDLYRQAAADFGRNTAVYKSLQKARELKEVDYENLAGLNALLTAGGCPASDKLDLFKSNPGEIVGFETNVDVLDNLKEVAQAGERVAMLAKFDKNYDLARKYAEAIEVLGYHLYKERAAYDELSKAESIFGQVNRVLIDIDRAQNLPDKEAAQKAFDDARLAEFQAKVDPCSKLLHSFGPDALTKFSGDFYLLAGDHTADKVWRVEAIRRVGRLRFDAENKADQLKSPKFLTRMSVDPAEDPLIQAAATTALNMTTKDNQCNR